VESVPAQDAGRIVTFTAGRRRKESTMANQVSLTEAEVRAFSSLLSRVSERLATYEDQTQQDQRYAEELREASNDLLSRLGG